MKRIKKLNLLFLFLIYHSCTIIQVGEKALIPMQKQSGRLPHIVTQTIGSIVVDTRKSKENILRDIAEQIDDKVIKLAERSVSAILPLVTQNQIYQLTVKKRKSRSQINFFAIAAAKISDEFFSRTLSPNSKFNSIHKAVKTAKNFQYFDALIELSCLCLDLDLKYHKDLSSIDSLKFEDLFKNYKENSTRKNFYGGIKIFTLHTIGIFIWQQSFEFIKKRIIKKNSKKNPKSRKDVGEKTQASKIAELVNKIRNTN